MVIMRSQETKRWEITPNHPIIGRWFKGYDERIYFCNAADVGGGYWMTAVTEPDGRLSDEPAPEQFSQVGRSRRTSVSHSAINRTFHRIHEDGSNRSR